MVKPSLKVSTNHIEPSQPHIEIPVPQPSLPHMETSTQVVSQLHLTMLTLDGNIYSR